MCKAWLPCRRAYCRKEKKGAEKIVDGQPLAIAVRGSQRRARCRLPRLGLCVHAGYTTKRGREAEPPRRRWRSSHAEEKREREREREREKGVADVLHM